MRWRFVLVLAISLLVGVVFWGQGGRAEKSRLVVQAEPPTLAEQAALEALDMAAVPGEPAAPPVVTPLTPEEEAAAEKERHKAIDREHMTQLRAGILAYLAKHGHYPEYLTQLVPEFVAAEVLYSPRKKQQREAVDRADLDHPDPGLAKPSYGYEFSNVVFRDGRTFAEIKEVQRREWGDVVPLLRCFAYGEGEVMNMAYGGDIYETTLNWEWDAGTLDLVEKYGWGPGLTTGEFVRVQVLQPNGQPAANAQVWADGRNFSFDLPNRPFATDASGWATIPVGVDLDRTALSLRAEFSGMASATLRYPVGEMPQTAALSMAPAVTVGGTAVDAAGNPLANSRVYLQMNEDAARKPTVTTVRTDRNGRWTAAIHSGDLQNLSAVIGVPSGPPIRYLSGKPLDAAAARTGTAVVQADW